MTILDILMDTLLLDMQELKKFASTSPYRYKVYQIPKRNSKKKRTIAHPSKELKFIQRALNGILSNILPVHEAVFSYKKEVSIKDNAQKHLKSQYLLKMDFKNFFPSITPEIFFDQLDKNNISYSVEDREIISRLLFWKPSRYKEYLSLSIGAPSSPLISNFIMYSFDKKINDYCNNINVTYTRYADDITFTTNVRNILFDIPNEIKKILLEEFSGKIIINNKKTIFSSKANNRHVTGIRLTNDNKLSIGRNKKRVLSSKVHHYSLGKINDDEAKKLQGELAFTFYIEPEFESKLIKKYGLETLLKLNKI
ncbi:retron-type reverse transcriptase [Cricetibacter osteomyelitidis]|uniref:RNA-directed DNA polymerase n=1 Tax=Cricetibacter osteomyelitidis TaxID=1521931 RepID=A0A4R2T201_9PAST|nr:retron St85 family RNA-directed DNA polymerase [Cricetibacter osteomyelitidis]TCP96190.1 retron-type reverse transcriptase [Cricetibacter osteomyelitidis]